MHPSRDVSRGGRARANRQRGPPAANPSTGATSTPSPTTSSFPHPFATDPGFESLSAPLPYSFDPTTSAADAATLASAAPFTDGYGAPLFSFDQANQARAMDGLDMRRECPQTSLTNTCIADQKHPVPRTEYMERFDGMPGFHLDPLPSDLFGSGSRPPSPGPSQTQPVVGSSVQNKRRRGPSTADESAVPLAQRLSQQSPFTVYDALPTVQPSASFTSSRFLPFCAHKRSFILLWIGQLHLALHQLSPARLGRQLLRQQTVAEVHDHRSQRQECVRKTVRMSNRSSYAKSQTRLRTSVELNVYFASMTTSCTYATKADILSRRNAEALSPRKRQVAKVVRYGPRTSTGQWRTHLLAAHAAEWKAACEQMKLKIKSSRAQHLLDNQNGLNGLEEDDIYTREDFVNALTEFVVADDQVGNQLFKTTVAKRGAVQSFNVARHPKLHRIFKLLRPSLSDSDVPSRDTVRARVGVMFSEHMRNLKQELADVSFSSSASLIYTSDSLG
jgi:hypothetical protein